MSKKKYEFDVDKFIDELTMDDEIADYITGSGEETDLPYRSCPNCGSDDYGYLVTDKFGKPRKCTECMHDPEN